MTVCPRCGTYAPPHAQFCERCGELLSHAGPVGGTEPDGAHNADPWNGRPPASDPWDGGYPDWNAGPPPLPPVPHGAEPQPSWPTGALHDDDPPTDPGFGAWNAPGRPDPGQHGWSGGSPPGWAPGKGEPRRANGSRMALLGAVGLVVVIALMAGGIYLARSGSDDAGAQPESPPPSPAASTSSAPSPTTGASASGNTPDTQAKAVDQVLDKAVMGKRTLAGAYGKALTCTISPSKAEDKFAAAAKNRRTVVHRARKLRTGKLPHGGKIKQLLIAVYTTSAKADDAFAGWAHAGDNAGKKCLSANAKRATGNRLSVRAGKKKRRFVKAWNPIAKEYGYPHRSADDI